jgi:hypothetical protein
MFLVLLKIQFLFLNHLHRRHLLHHVDNYMNLHLNRHQQRQDTQLALHQ